MLASSSVCPQLFFSASAQDGSSARDRLKLHLFERGKKQVLMPSLSVNAFISERAHIHYDRSILRSKSRRVHSDSKRCAICVRATGMGALLLNPTNALCKS